MPIVQINLMEGRSEEQKREAAKKITEAIVETLACPPSAVSIIFNDMAKWDYATGGVLYKDRK